MRTGLAGTKLEERCESLEPGLKRGNILTFATACEEDIDIGARLANIDSQVF